jgi:hypothetical protein
VELVGTNNLKQKVPFIHEAIPRDVKPTNAEATATSETHISYRMNFHIITRKQNFIHHKDLNTETPAMQPHDSAASWGCSFASSRYCLCKI